MKTIVSFVFVAALLPIVIFGAVMKDKLSLTASADANPVLRVWFEPANVVLKPGQQIPVKVVAESEAVKKLVGKLHLELTTLGEVVVSPQSVIFDEAFVGRTQVGTIMISGTGEVNVDIAASSTVPGEFVLQTSKLTVR